ncbi:flavohemoprotein [Amorphoplanes nipponensis]|uniref:nitric oxide dioxygenase n=1 Tax=Actinoplanes nipponensis TaxID=135950 RepID=A0A919MTI9_9ACTN|nr:globin domain-containing protein [Actinoplanes nipponensis]GIE53673.1 flavohemoprotein [Actinoplanes nipponensis]
MTSLSTILKESWGLVEDRKDRVAAHFYARLFLSHPQLRELFPVQMDTQRARLLGAIVSAVQNFDNPEGIDGYLRSLGRDHRKFHVTPEHYAQVKVALIDAIRSHAGEQWTSVYEQAWNDVYDHIAATMTAGAAGDTNPPYWHAEVVHHERRGADVAVFTCRPLQPLAFRAGQYVSIECGYQPRLWRTYSIANAPRADGTLDFHVRAAGGGWVSGALVRRLRAGDMLRLAAPMGSMTLDPQSRRDIVFITGGTGLAPVKALLDELTRYNRTRWIHLFRGERQRDDFYDHEHLDRIAESFPWLTIVRAVSDEQGYPGERGAIPDVVSRHGPWRDHDFYVAGSAAMVNATLRRLTEMCIPSTRIKYDAFTDA